MKLVRKYERELRKSKSMSHGSLSNQQAITYEAASVENAANPLVPLQGQTSLPTTFKESDLALESLVEVLTKQLQRGRVETKLAVLRWVYHLFNICQPKVSNISCIHQMLYVYINFLLFSSISQRNSQKHIKKQ